jgi:hypothetical protein
MATHESVDLSGFTKNHNFAVNLIGVNKIAPNINTLVATYIYITFGVFKTSLARHIHEGCSKSIGPWSAKIQLQCSLDLPFFKGREKMIGECGETVNRENHFFKQKKLYIVFCFLAEFCLN